jgi:hypothetical protein
LKGALLFDAYASAGISAKELEDNFSAELTALVENSNMTYGGALAEMKKRYDGYADLSRGYDEAGQFRPVEILGKR